MSSARIGGGVVLAALAISILGVAPVDAARASVRVVGDPAHPRAPIEIRLTDKGTIGVAQVHLLLGRRLRAGEEPRFALAPLRVVEPAYAQLPSPPLLAIVFGGRNITNGGFRPRYTGAFGAELRIGRIDTIGTFRTELLTGLGAAPKRVRIPVIIRRYPNADLRLAAFANGTRTVTTSRPSVDIPLDVVGANAGTAENVRLDVDEPRTADGIAAKVDVLEDEVGTSIVGTAVARRTIRVTLPQPGSYVAPARLSWDGGSRDLMLTVNWTLPDLGLSILAVQGANSDLPTCVEFAGRRYTECTADALWMSVQETAGRTVTVDPPMLRSLIKRQGGNEFAAPGVSLATTLDCVGSHATATASGSVQSCGRASLDPATGALTLQPGAIARLRMRLLGALGAGEYIAHLEMSGDSTTTVGSEASLSFRLPALAAFLIFLLGCVLALPIRAFLIAGRKRLLQQARISRYGTILDDLYRRASDAETTAMVDAVHRAAGRVLDTLVAERRIGDEADRWIDDLELRVGGLDRWLSTWSDAETLPAGGRNRVQSRLASLGRILAKSDLLSDSERRSLDEIDTLEETLTSVAVARSATSPRDPRLRRKPKLRMTVWRDLQGSLRTRLRWGTRIETSLLILLTSLAGLAFIWAPNPTWGSLTDLLIAMLWSIAVLTVATASFTGILGLRSQLAREQLIA